VDAGRAWLVTLDSVQTVSYARSVETLNPAEERREAIERHIIAACDADGNWSLHAKDAADANEFSLYWDANILVGDCVSGRIAVSDK
jgi:hypothetical protein